jgi:hypothetical protein
LEIKVTFWKKDRLIKTCLRYLQFFTFNDLISANQWQTLGGTALGLNCGLLFFLNFISRNLPACTVSILGKQVRKMPLMLKNFLNQWPES